MSEQDMQSERAALQARREELRARLESIEADYRRGLDRDSEEQAQELENAEVLDGIARAVAAELAQVEERLAELA